MLNSVPDREEIRQMDRKQLNELSSEIRGFLIDKVSKKGGHLASNLGTVELTLALWRCFDFPKDRLIFDVGHQCYTWKLLTGRMEGFDTFREFGGMSGFPKANESPYDTFNTGHSSTSLSLGLGLVRARDLKGENYKVISVIGDGAFTGGEAYEALNNASVLRTNFIIILNDNEMSISRNVGGVTKILTNARSSKGYNNLKTGVKKVLSSSQGGQALIRTIDDTKDSLKELMLPSGMIFENLGLKYLGPVDGHDVLGMEKIMKSAMRMNRAVVIHVLTQKGRGYEPARMHPLLYHGVGPFDPETGIIPKPHEVPTYADILGAFMAESGERHTEICAVTAAMGENVGFHRFKKRFRNRFFDVGIAEQHAVTFAAGLAKGGMHPYTAIYSSFLQRAYDQIIMDCALQNLPVVFLMDRAGLVGRDGETHHGLFDIPYMTSVPNMTVMAPKDGAEFRKMLDWSLTFDTPLSIRYPRGAAEDTGREPEEIVLGKAESPVYFGNEEEQSDVSILSAGTMFGTAIECAEKLAGEGLSVQVVNMRFMKPLDRDTVLSRAEHSSLVVTLEDGLLKGGFGEQAAALISEELCGQKRPKVLTVGVRDTFVPQGTVSELMKWCGMDADTIVSGIRAALRQEKTEEKEC